MTTGKKKRGKKQATLAETQSRDPKQIRQKDEFDPLHQVAFWGLALLLFFPPYFRGLFFAPEQEKALIFATLVFWLAFLWRWLKRDYKFMRGPLDWFALALPLVYIITSFTAVNKGLAIDEVVKNILYFMTYWSVSRLVRNREDVHRILHVIYASAIGVALAGLAAATEIIHINDGFLHGRIYSSFQYPNALASYLAAVSLLGFYFWQHSSDYTVGKNLAGRSTGLPEWLVKSNPWGYLYACGNFLLLAVLIGTKSRGGLLVFSLVLIIYLLGLGARNRLATTLHAGVTGGLAAICITKFIPLAMAKHYNPAWVWMLAGLVLAITWQALFRQVIEKFILARWQPGQFNLAFGVLAGITLVAVAVFLRSVGDIWEKVVAFFQDYSAVTRMDFVNDAIEMIMQKPLLGWGGGGWREAYRSFQDYLYNSNEVHSYYFQVGVETGLLGLLAVAGIWLSFMYYCFRIYRQRQNNPAAFQFACLMLACFLTIAGHALIDFDLSLSALTMVLWAFFGLTGATLRLQENNAEQQAEAPKPKRRTGQIPAAAPLVIASTTALLVIIPAIILAQSHASAQQASRFFQIQQVEKGLEYLEKAVTQNPFNADFRVTLSQVYRARSEHDKAIEQAMRAVELSPFNSQCRVNLADVYISAEKYESGIEQAEKAVELAPLQRQWYEMLAERYFIAGYLNLEKGNKEEAKTYLRQAAALPDKMQVFMDNVSEENLKMWKGPKIVPEHKIWFNSGAAKYLLGDYNNSDADLQKAAKSKDNNIKSRALIWRAMVAEKKGQKQKVRNLLNQAEKLNKDARQQYDQLKKLPVLK